MRVPESLAGLLDQGIVQEIVRPLMSGKEAQVYLVIAGGQQRVAKIYKDSQHRSFQQRAEYTEGRRTRNSRDQRAMQKRTKYGREQDEAAWKSAEVDMIYRLRYAGVRVPEPFTFVDGVLLMELVQDADGNPAPRLAEVDFTPEEARAIFDLLLQEVIKMLCAGVVHGDLSEYNVLLAESGPVIIDFPQSVDAAANQSAKRLLLRDVDNLTRFLTRLDHRAHRMPYGQEIWSAYERNRLTPGMSLTGRAQRSTGNTDTRSLLDEIAASDRDEEHRRRALGLPPRRREVTMQPSGSSQGRGDGRARNDGRGSADRRGPPGAPRSDARGPSGAPRSDARGPSGAPRSDGRGPADRRTGPSEPRSEARGPAIRRDAPAEARSDGRGPADRRAAEEQRDGRAHAQQDGAPARRRRRRRKKGGNGAAPGTTGQPAASTSAAPPVQGRGEGGDPRVRERSHDRPREAPREPSGSADAQRERNGTHDASDSQGAPPKRRRRRRRRPGEGQPPTGHPGGAG